MTEENRVLDYCDDCGAIITEGEIRTVVNSSDTPGVERILCGPCAAAEHDRLWNGPWPEDS